jgi:FkbM family methyltransferase
VTLQTSEERTAVEADPVIRVDTADGPMWVFKSDIYVSRSLAVYGEYVVAEADVFRQIVKPGMTVVEIGANIGSHSVMLARACAPGLLLAFEPQQRVFQLLTANLVGNHVPNARVFPEALGASHSMIDMREPDYARRGNFGSFSLTKGPATGDRIMRVRVSPLDSWELDACHFMKIDVEGLECDVIKGATHTIKRHRPIIYTENDRADQQGALIDLLTALDYTLYWHIAPLFRPNNFRGVTENVFGDTASLNMICVPSERTLPVRGPQKIDPANWVSPFRGI